MAAQAGGFVEAMIGIELNDRWQKADIDVPLKLSTLRAGACFQSRRLHSVIGRPVFLTHRG